MATGVTSGGVFAGLAHGIAVGASTTRAAVSVLAITFPFPVAACVARPAQASVAVAILGRIAVSCRLSCCRVKQRLYVQT